MKIRAGALLTRARGLFTALFAVAALSGCASYQYAGDTAPGGYYYGRPTTEYYGGYGSYGYGGSIGYGHGSYGYPGYGYYDRYPHYGGHYNYPYYPGYRPQRPPPPRPGGNGNGHQPPPNGGSAGNRPPPWRDPTNGAWRESGKVKIPPQNRVMAEPSRPQRMEQPVRVRPSRPEARYERSGPDPEMRTRPTGERASGRRNGVRMEEP